MDTENLFRTLIDLIDDGRLVVFDPETATLKEVVQLGMNGKCVQLRTRDDRDFDESEAA